MLQFMNLYIQKIYWRGK